MYFDLARACFRNLMYIKKETYKILKDEILILIFGNSLKIFEESV